MNFLTPLISIAISLPIFLHPPTKVIKPLKKISKQNILKIPLLLYITRKKLVTISVHVLSPFTMSSDNRDHYWFNGHGHHSFWPNPSTYDRNSKIMLAAVVSLSAVILFVFILHLYARFVLRRRRETFRGLPVVVRHPFQTPKRGLDPTLIASLPSFTVRDVASATECAVCLSLLEEQDTARELPSCKHVFHVDCVDKWLTACSTCPVCRTEVQPRPRLEPEPREGPVGGDGVSSPPTAPLFLDDVLSVEAAASSSSGDKTAVPPVSRLDSFRKILTRERSSNRINHSCVDQERVPDHV